MVYAHKPYIKSTAHQLSLEVIQKRTEMIQLKGLYTFILYGLKLKDKTGDILYFSYWKIGKIQLKNWTLYTSNTILIKKLYLSAVENSPQNYSARVF